MRVILYESDFIWEWFYMRVVLYESGFIWESFYMRVVLWESFYMRVVFDLRLIHVYKREEWGQWENYFPNHVSLYEEEESDL